MYKYNTSLRNLVSRDFRLLQAPMLEILHPQIVLQAIADQRMKGRDVRYQLLPGESAAEVGASGRQQRSYHP